MKTIYERNGIVVDAGTRGDGVYVVVVTDTHAADLWAGQLVYIENPNQNDVETAIEYARRYRR